MLPNVGVSVRIRDCGKDYTANRAACACGWQCLNICGRISVARFAQSKIADTARTHGWPKLLNSLNRPTIIEISNSNPIRENEQKGGGR